MRKISWCKAGEQAKYCEREEIVTESVTESVTEECEATNPLLLPLGAGSTHISATVFFTTKPRVLTRVMTCRSTTPVLVRSSNPVASNQTPGSAVLPKSRIAHLPSRGRLVKSPGERAKRASLEEDEHTSHY